jgi:hypothetical protein
MPDWTDRAARRMYARVGLGLKDVDVFNPYDGYAHLSSPPRKRGPRVATVSLDAPGCPLSRARRQRKRVPSVKFKTKSHGVKRGDAFAFYAGDIRVEGPHPFSSSGGNLGTGRCRTAMYTDSIEQLRGTAGARQVRVRAETALAAFTTPSNGGWIMFGKHPS